MIDNTFEIQGLDELDDKLAELTDVMKRKVIEQSLMAASLPMMKKAKDNAAVSEAAHNLRNSKTGAYTLIQPGTMKNSVKRQRLKDRLDPTVTIRVGKKNRSAPYPYYWHFVEHGNSNMAAIPFLRPAFEQTWQQVVERFKDEMHKRIDKLTGSP